MFVAGVHTKDHTIRPAPSTPHTTFVVGETSTAMAGKSNGLRNRTMYTNDSAASGQVQFGSHQRTSGRTTNAQIANRTDAVPSPAAAVVRCAA